MKDFLLVKRKDKTEKRNQEVFELIKGGFNCSSFLILTRMSCPTVKTKSFSSRCLYIQHLPSEITGTGLAQLFSSFGKLVSYNVVVCCPHYFSSDLSHAFYIAYLISAELSAKV